MSPTDEFATRVEAFFDAVPQVLDGVVGDVERGKAYRQALVGAGLAGLDVPTAYGGAGLDTVAKATFDTIARARAPREADLFMIGLGMCIPTILDHGSESLKARYVEKALRGEEIWCQMYSEPGAGSDLAALATRATRTDDGWSLSGQKVWTSQAQHAQFGICLARTDVDVPKHRGITMFVVPMDQPGVTVRPIPQITGDQEFNEVFLDDARVPADHHVGPIDGGWKVAVSLLLKERRSIGAGGGRQPVSLERLRDLVAASPLREVDHVRDRLVDAYLGQTLAALFDERQAHIVAAGGLLDGETSLGKLWRSVNGRLASELITEVAFAAGTSWEAGDSRDRWTWALLDACALPIGGGTDEVQKNAIAEQVLGLPKDPFQTDHIPFRELRTDATRQEAR